jgi:hypothetical protein
LETWIVKNTALSYLNGYTISWGGGMVVGSGMRPVIPPTNRSKLEAKKTCDIINPSFQGYGGDLLL